MKINIFKIIYISYNLKKKVTQTCFLYEGIYHDSTNNCQKWKKMEHTLLHLIWYQICWKNNNEFKETNCHGGLLILHIISYTLGSWKQHMHLESRHASLMKQYISYHITLAITRRHESMLLYYIITRYIGTKTNGEKIMTSPRHICHIYFPSQQGLYLTVGDLGKAGATLIKTLLHLLYTPTTLCGRYYTFITGQNQVLVFSIKLSAFKTQGLPNMRLHVISHFKSRIIVIDNITSGNGRWHFL